MIPKEHGAWNALLVCLFGGWMSLAEWNMAAVAVSLLWFSGFILRAPLATARQYRLADPQRSRRAWGFSLVLIGILAFSGLVFYKTAPPKALLAVWAGALPLGFLLSLFAYYRRTLKFLAAELAGFAGISLLAPVIYLTRSDAAWNRALLLYALFGGYFLLALLYVRMRLGWKKRDKTSGQLSLGTRLYHLRGPLLVWIIYVLSVHECSRMNVWLLAGPFYSGGRVFAGALWGNEAIPTIKLGIEEMVHSLVFMVISILAWNFN